MLKTNLPTGINANNALGFLKQVISLRIHFLNQSDLPQSVAFLQAFLTQNGIFHCIEHLIPHQPVAPKAAAKPFQHILLRQYNTTGS